MKNTTLIAAALLSCGYSVITAQSPSTEQKVSAVRQAVLQNQSRLRGYQWLETTEVSIKGELKNRRQAECRFSADGKLQRTPVGAPSAPNKPRGLKGKLAAGKIEEMEDYIERLGSLVSRYLPPNAEAMQAAFKSGKTTIDSSSGSIVFTDYAKPGDKVTFQFDPDAKRLSVIRVATYLDNAQDAVAIDVTFEALPDGTNTTGQSIIDATAKRIRIKRTNSDYKKV
jgi:hypothetical protein